MIVFFTWILKNRGGKGIRNAAFRNGGFGNAKREKNGGFSA